MLRLESQSQPTFSLSAEMLHQVLEHAKPLGHHENTANLNLGFGFLYYGLVRTLRHDFLATLRHTHRNSYLLLHDTNIYVRELVRHAGVKRWLKRVARAEDHFEVIDFPFSSGVALVRVLQEGTWEDRQ